jgi:beta-glucanase (GH16 family)
VTAGDNPPSNLSFTVKVAETGSGDVTVNASASDATQYQIYFGEDSPDAGVSSTSGLVTYHYSVAGTYSIRVVASNGSATTVEETQTVTVVITPPSNLDFTIEVASDGSGFVNVEATADHTTTYKIFFGETPTDFPIETSLGKASYQYGESGSYTVKVVALNATDFTMEVSKPIEVNVVAPQNLSVTTEVSTDGTGTVTVHASAENTTGYQLFFGESDPDTGESSADGNFTYQYGTSGTYTIKVVAKNDSKKTEESENEITVTVVPQIPATGYSTPQTYDGMTLVWSDEFDGSTINEADWTFETGGNGWGNNELEFYRRENAEIYQGSLMITAKKESFSASQYTSARMVTKDKQTFKYGRVDIRAALPKGQGIWPALWMLGNNIGEVGWPKCGEIDIMEMVGGSGNKNKTVYGTLHWESGGQRVCTCDKPGYTLPSGIFNDEFHVFSIVWNSSNITWYVDDVQFNQISVTPADLNEFHEQFFFIFNLAVGGNWPGSPDATTKFPQRMFVDYVRVFQ